MTDTLGGHAPSYATVKRWGNEDEHGKDNVEDEPRSGRPLTATTPENIDLVLDMIMEDRRIPTNQIAKPGWASRRSEQITIIRDELGMSKVSARWVPVF